MAAGISAGVAFIDILPNMARFSAGVGAGMRRAGSQMMTLGSRMSRILTVPILAAAAASVKMGLDFQRSMEMVKTQAGASQKEVDKMSKAMLALAPQVGTGPEELAKGIFHVESVGYRGAKALSVMKVAAMGAKVGMSDLEDTASALSGVLITNIKGTENQSHAMGTLNAIIGAGNMHMQDLNDAIKSGIIPTAKTAGLSLSGIGAALAMMTDEGIPAGIAANRLRTSLFMLTNPTEKAAGVLKKIGLTTTSLGHDLQKPDGLQVAMTDLKKHMADVKDPTERLAMIGQMFGGSRSAGTIALLLNNLSRIKIKYDQINKTAKTYASQVQSTRQTAQFKLDQAWAAIQADLIKTSAALIPIALTLAGAITKLADGFSNLSPQAQKVITYAALVAAALGPILFVAGSVVTVVGTLASVFAVVGGALVSVIGIMPGFTLAMSEGEGAILAFGETIDIAIPELGLLALGFVAVGAAVAGFLGWMSSGSDETQRLKDASDSAKTAVEGLNGALNASKNANEKLKQSRHQEKADTDAVAAAELRYHQILKDPNHTKLDAAQALDSVHSALDALHNQKGQVVADEAAKEAQTKKTNAAIKKSIEQLNILHDKYHNEVIPDIHDTKDGYKGLEGAAVANAAAHRKNAAALAEYVAGLRGAAIGYGVEAAAVKKSDPVLSRFLHQQQQVATETANLTDLLGKVPTMTRAEILLAFKTTTTANAQVNAAHGGGRRSNAAGGYLGAGQASVVGELGPEVFVPSNAGRIVPNSRIGNLLGGGGGGGGRHAITITNWETGQGYMEDMADNSVVAADRHKRQIDRMGR